MAKKKAARTRRSTSPKPGRQSPDTVDLSTLTLDPGNSCVHDDRNLEVITGSISDVGAGRSILMDGDGIVRAGNGTVLGAQRAGLSKARIIESDGTELIVVKRTDLKGAKAVAAGLADNRASDLHGYDADRLKDQLAEIEHELPDLDLDGIGLSTEDIDGLLAKLDGEDGDEETEPVDVVEDEVPEPTKKATTKPGDLWILGRHRLLCGDSTESANVQRLMNGEKAKLMNTDPPYGIAYKNNDRPGVKAAKPRVAKPRVAKPRVANDELTDEKLQKFLEAVFRSAAKDALVANAAWYLWHAHLTQGFFAAAAAANVMLHRQIIWVKPVLVFGRGHYHWKHEPCFMGWVKGNQPPDYGKGNGERNQTTVWEIGNVSQSDRKEFNHSTPKPVELFTIPIVKHTQIDDVVYEPFAGSGPQFIAAEQLDRKCYGMEISPQFCDVIIKRWEKFTDRKAERVKA